MKSKLSIILTVVYLLTGCTAQIPEEYPKQTSMTLCPLNNKNKLIQLAEKKFGKLTEADRILFTAMEEGNWANYTEGNNRDKPENASSWGARRTIDANRIEWLCRDKQIKEIVSDKGITIAGAKIKGAVDLSFAEVPFPLAFVGCVFTEEINILHSRIEILNLGGSHTGSICADGAKIEGGLFLRDGFEANGDVRFPEATIGGDFDCTNGKFVNKSGKAIFATRIEVKDSVFLKNGFKANREVCFLGAKIGGNFDCQKGEFVNKGGTAISADRMVVKGNVFFRNGFKSNGEVSFSGAVIDGNFECDGGTFIKKDGYAISAERMNIKGSVFLRDGFKANGKVCFGGASISGDFVCGNSEVVNEGSYAISADGTDIKGSVFLSNGLKANGEVRFLGTEIGGNFDCENSEFINEGNDTISADGMNVKGSVLLRNGFKANGGVRFPRAVINGNLECKDGNFINKDGYAIAANRIEVKGNVLLSDGFKANGEVRFLGAVIDGDFYCEGGSFININKDQYAIAADRMNVRGNVFLINGFNAKGEVRLLEATIDGQFNCQNGKFINKGGKAITANGMEVKDKVLLTDGFKAEGEVSFPMAIIGGNFVCENSEFINKGGRAFSADGIDVKGSVFLRNGFKAEGLVSIVGAIINGHFFWSDINHPEKTILDLRNAKARVLCDDEKSWPAKGNLFLDGFVYENIGDYAPKDAKSRIKWLDRQGEKRFRSGPYEQLAKVLEKIGHNKDAIKIRIEKEEKITRLNRFGWWTRVWKGSTIGYGYRPWQALWWMGGFIVLGFIVFRKGYKADIIVQTEEKKYNKFNALFYSIEKFVPVVNLSMAKHWIPDANKRWGAIVRCYMWLHIIAGWIFTTLLIVGLTGLVKK